MKVHGSIGLQLLTCLLVYVTDVHSIMVKYGTRDGPIVPPEPSRTPPSPRRLDFFQPAPVWENREGDTPDPNAMWKPSLFKPFRPQQQRHTEVVLPDVNLRKIQPTTYKPTNYAQKVANSYRAINAQEPYILSSQLVPGVGLSYFMPAYAEATQSNEERDRRTEEETNENSIDENDVQQTSESQLSHVYHWHTQKTLATPTLSAFNYSNPPTRPSTYIPPPYISRKRHE